MPTRYGRPVDSQRAKVYSGEWYLDGQRQRENRPKRTFSTLEDMQAFVDEVCGSEFVRKQWGSNPRITVRRRHGHSKAHYEIGRGVIAIPMLSQTASRAGGGSYVSWAQTDRVILHEIAHGILDQCLRHRDEHGRRVAAHSREFARIMVALVGKFVGKDEAKWLKEGYRKSGAKFIKSRGPLSAEQRERAREILADARETAIATGRAPAGVAAAAQR